MKTLADFKRKLKAAINSQQLVQVTIRYASGAVIKLDPTTVGGVQQKDFYVMRNDARSWIEFGSAKEWHYTETVATHDRGERQAIIEFLPLQP